jgi:hypothetical protein
MGVKIGKGEQWSSKLFSANGQYLILIGVVGVAESTMSGAYR